MQQQQAEHLRQLINSSSILTQAEKSDWLDVLILMNDKQASELETILAAQKPPAPSIAPQASAPIPPLNHISNLPSSINRPAYNSAPAVVGSVAVKPAVPAPKPAPAMPWQKQFEATMAEKELTGPNNASQSPPIKHTPVPAQKVHSLTSVPKTPQPVMPRTQPPRPAPVPEPAGPVTLETLADAGTLTLGSLRSMNKQDLFIRLQQLSKMEGYFNLLSYLEDSPLYKSYILTGKKVLAQKLAFDQKAQTSPETLTKDEFEAFADMLRKIQIN